MNCSSADSILEVWQLYQHEFCATNFATALHRIGKKSAFQLRLSGLEAVSALTPHCMAQISCFNARELSCTAWSLSQIRLKHNPLLAAIAAESMKKISEFLV